MDKNLLKENRIHGDVLFPLEVYEMRYTNPNSGLECHWHDELELLILTEGSALFQIETTNYELLKGQAVFINGGEIHAGFPLNKSPWGFYAVVFNPTLMMGASYDSIRSKYMEPLLKRQLLHPRLITANTQWERQILDCLNEMIRLFTAKQFTYELLVKARLYEILSLILQSSEPRVQDREFSSHQYGTERLKKALSYIQAHFNRRISLTELAMEANMSEGHFCRFFKQMVNKTPVDYINSFKINKAARMLEDSDIKIIDAAMEVGFDNFSYFISIFKHYMNCTPSEYRKKTVFAVDVKGTELLALANANNSVPLTSPDIGKPFRWLQRFRIS